MSHNPYEAPSAAVLEEADRARMVLDSSQRAVVERFIWLNHQASSWIIVLGAIVALLVTLFLVIDRERFGLLAPFGSVGAGIVLIVLGDFQRKRNIVAISLTSVALVSLVVGVLIHLSLAALKANEGKELGFEQVARGLFLLGIMAIAVWKLAWGPIWLAGRAWLWRVQGIDLTTLENMEYRRTVKPLVMPPGFPKGDT